MGEKSELYKVFELTECTIWGINIHYKLIGYNSKFRQSFMDFFHLPVNLGENLIGILPESKLKYQWKKRYDKAFQGEKQSYKDTYTIRGINHTFEIKILPSIENGIIDRVFVFSKDISPSLNIEKKYEKIHHKFIKTKKELDSLIYRASHDLRAPLTTIMGLINLIKMEEGESTKLTYLDLMSKSISKMDFFIREIILLSKNDHSEIQSEEINFHLLLEEIWKSLFYLEKQDKIRKIIVIQKDLKFYSDLDRVKTILTNLISNAISFADFYKNTSFVKIRISSHSYKKVRIQILDNGQGIRPEYQDKIFQMFYKANDIKNGSGLGLYIVKEMLDKINGTIEVKSEYGKGTVFSLEIPDFK